MWKLILNDRYEVSEAGQVRRAVGGQGAVSGRILIAQTDRDGYLIVYPRVDGRQRSMLVHRLVAAAFLGACPPGHQVNHIDGFKRNNHHSNLEYVTRLENMRHAARTGLLRRGERHPRSKLSDADVELVVSMRLAGESMAKIAVVFGVNPSTIFYRLKGRALT